MEINKEEYTECKIDDLITPDGWDEEGVCSYSKTNGCIGLNYIDTETFFKHPHRYKFYKKNKSKVQHALDIVNAKYVRYKGDGIVSIICDWESTNNFQDYEVATEEDFIEQLKERYNDK